MFYETVVQSEANRLMRATQGRQTPNPLERIARCLDAGVAAVEHGDRQRGLGGHEPAALRCDRPLDAVRAAFGGVPGLLLSQPVGEGAVPVVQGDEDTQVLSLEHRWRFRVIEADGPLVA